MPDQYIQRTSPDDVKLYLSEKIDCVMLRLNPNNVEGISGIRALTKCELPLTPFSSSNNNGYEILWLSQDKWLFLTKHETAINLCKALQETLSNSHTLITDLSDAYSVICVEGSKAREVMMRCGTIDFSADSFTKGMVMRAGFAETNAIYHLSQTEPLKFNLFVPRSYGNYAYQWIKNAIRMI